jgi:predicted kinase
VTVWRDRSLAAIQALRPWFTQRSADGFVRRCHGDLHLGNVCLWDGAPVPFDALEFDEALATIDTGYDSAFLLMDLEQRVSRAAANRVMNRYVARTGDAGLLHGLKVFLSQRAMIRAHVAAAMGQAQPALLQAALAYLSPEPARVVAIGGLQGTGKSTLARALAPDMGPAPGALVLRSDEIRKRLFGCAPEQRLPAEAYTEGANQRVNRCLIDSVCLAAAAGHSVIADSTFLDPAMRADLAARVAFTGIWLRAPLAVLEQRVAARQGDASDATVAVLRRSAARDTGPPEGWLAVDATDLGSAVAQVSGMNPNIAPNRSR